MESGKVYTVVEDLCVEDTNVLDSCDQFLGNYSNIRMVSHDRHPSWCKSKKKPSDNNIKHCHIFHVPNYSINKQAPVLQLTTTYLSCEQQTTVSLKSQLTVIQLLLWVHLVLPAVRITAIQWLPPWWSVTQPDNHWGHQPVQTTASKLNIFIHQTTGSINN